MNLKSGILRTSDLNSLFHQSLIETETAIYRKQEQLKQQSATLILAKKTGDFWKDKNFWKDRNPIAIDEFVTDRLGKKPTPKQLEILFKLAGTDPYEWDTTYHKYIIAIGMGGGKNEYIISPFLAYASYKVANMRDPYSYFDRFRNPEYPLDRTKDFDFVNMSTVGERQAKNVHFKNMIKLIRKCNDGHGDNWFEKYAAMNLVEGGSGNIKEKQVTIQTIPGCGNIVHHSFDSTYTAWEGLSVLFSVNDETSRADTKATYNDLAMSWEGQVGNTSTRFPQRAGKVMAISYLNCSEYDFTYDQLLLAMEEEKLTDKPLTYYCNLSTFECNPNVSKEDDSIKSAYRTDPITSAARYEGKKGASINSFYQPHPETIRGCFYKMVSPVDYIQTVTERIIRDPSTQMDVRKKYSSIGLHSIRGDNRIRGIALDPAIKYDAFILKCGYNETMDEMRESIFIDNKIELVTVNKRPIIDIVMVWQPKDGQPIDYINIGDIIAQLLTAFPNIRFMNSDKYNSEKLSQEVISRGVSSTTYGFGNAQQMRLYKKMRWLIHSSVPQIFKDDQHTLTRKGITKSVGEWNIEEHERLININDVRVDHPADFSKDLSDADAILINDLLALEINDAGISVGSNGVTEKWLMDRVDKYLKVRARLRNDGIKDTDKEFTHKAAELLNLTSAQTKSLREHVEDAYPNM